MCVCNWRQREDEEIVPNVSADKSWCGRRREIHCNACESYLEVFGEFCSNLIQRIPHTFHLNFDTFHVKRLNSASCCLTVETKTVRRWKICEIDSKNIRTISFFLVLVIQCLDLVVFVWTALIEYVMLWNGLTYFSPVLRII